MRNRRIVKITIRESNTTIKINNKSRFTDEESVKMIEEHIMDLLEEMGALN